MAPGKSEPLEPEEPRKCYGNQVGCILRECASINNNDLRSKEHLTQLLLTKLHKRFKFPDRDDNIEQPWDDPKMKKINNHAMGMFSNDLASWKGRVKRNPCPRFWRKIQHLRKRSSKSSRTLALPRQPRLRLRNSRAFSKGTRGSIASEAVATSVKGPYGIRRTRNVKPRVSQTPSRSSPTPWSMTSSGPATSGTRRKMFFTRTRSRGN